MLERRLKLGTFLGIGLYVHWTFGLMIAYIGYAARADGWVGVLYSIAQLLGVFLCVTLHEYGHAMAARQFGVPTLDITLLPIGGVARLQRMPRVPWQELVVAIAGPAVNVVIVFGLFFSLWGMFGSEFFGDAFNVFDEQSVITLQTLLTAPSAAGFITFLMVVNTFLILFNMIPAFPMDGGRVFRSLMAMTMTYRRATFVASRVGLVCAVLMVVFGLQVQWYMLVAIAAFIAYAGMAEARQVDVMETVRGLSIADSMIRHPLTLHQDTPISEIAARWQDTSATSLPVISVTGSVVGMLRIEDLAKAVRSGVPLNNTAGMLADHSIDVLRLDDDLELVLLASGRTSRQFPVVDNDNRLTGVLDLDSMLARSVVHALLVPQPYRPDSGFDAIS